MRVMPIPPESPQDPVTSMSVNPKPRTSGTVLGDRTSIQPLQKLCWTKGLKTVYQYVLVLAEVSGANRGQHQRAQLGGRLEQIDGNWALMMPCWSRIVPVVPLPWMA